MGSLHPESAWQINRRVIGALLLRELITRYGRNNIGFLWLFVEPMLFTLAITAFWAATRSVHGSDIPIVAFALTGYSSMMMWRNLPNRCIGALKSNKPLLYHRRVRIIDAQHGAHHPGDHRRLDELRRSRTRVLRDGLAGASGRCIAGRRGASRWAGSGPGWH